MDTPIDCQKYPVRYADEYKKILISGTVYLEFRDVKDLVRKYVKGKKALDYGCGSGKSTIFLKSLGLDVTGVDINEHIIKHASENDVNGNYQLITSANVPVDDNTYDLVFSSWVLVQVPTKSEINKIGREIGRILKPNGIFIMIVGYEGTYNKDWVSTNTEFPENQNLYSGCRIKTLFKESNLILHGYFWTDEDYKEMLECANMKILEIHKPLGKDSDGYNWNIEKFEAPVNIYVAQKVNNSVLTQKVNNSVLTKS